MNSKKFQDAFWGTDIVSTAGFDALCKRVKTGRRTCKAVADFFAQRAKIELEYSRSLQRLSNSVRVAELGESPLLTQAWLEVIHQTEKVVKIHEESSNVYKSESERVTAFNEEQKLDRMKVEDVAKRSQTNKISAYHKSLSLQRTYYGKCKESDMLKATLEGLQQQVNSQQKEIDKLRQRLERSNAAVEQADLNYKNSIDALEVAHCQWEKDMNDMCQVCEWLEHRRLEALRGKLWCYSNIGSRACVEEDNCYEAMRVKTELFDVELDLDEFITRHSTGTERPAHVEYINYYTGPTNQSINYYSGDHASVTSFSSVSVSSMSDYSESDYASVM